MVLAAVGLFGAGTASATTGNTSTTPVPALYRVPRQVAVLYPGQYSLQSAAPAARLRQLQLLIELNPIGYLQGVATIYGYDANGFPTSSVVTVYNFHLTALNRMTIEVLGPLGTPLLGYLYVRRTTRGDLVGQIAMASKTRYALTLHRNFGLPSSK